MRLSHFSLFPAVIFFSTLSYAESPRPIDGLVGGTFTVTDARARDEISEVSRLYINDHLVATFQLDLSHSIAHATIPLPVGRENVTYSLCGTVTVTRHGHPETHTVSSDGMLIHPDGHHYDAVSSENFTDFFLVDTDDIDPSTDHRSGRSHLCTTPNA